MGLPPTFNVLIATVGRPTLQNMLDSLSPQLSSEDCLTIVYDGKSSIPKFDTTKFKCKVNEFYEPIPLGYWGHGIRNKYANILEERTFVMHADDDDVYLTGAFDSLRKKCLSKKTLYIGKMQYMNCVFPPMDFSDKIKEGTIGTPCGIIPYKLNKRGVWLKRQGGDGSFYEQLYDITDDKVVCLSDVIYLVRPSESNNLSENRTQKISVLSSIRKQFAK